MNTTLQLAKGCLCNGDKGLIVLLIRAAHNNLEHEKINKSSIRFWRMHETHNIITLNLPIEQLFALQCLVIAILSILL